MLRQKRLKKFGQKTTEELPLSFEKRICVKCGKNEIYHDIKTMDWCEPCIWEFVKDDSNN